MFISVMNNENEEVFRGDAEDFIIANDYDEEVEDCITNLEYKRIGAKSIVYGFLGDFYIVEKIEEEEEF